jgi:hypothetical protein
MPIGASQLFPFVQERKISTTLPQGSSDGKPPNNLPAPLTNFIGRKQSLAALKDLLLGPEIRLVSLTEPGGTGKTRLALEVGRTSLDQFPHGEYFVDLAKISDPSIVTATIAHTLGIR